MWKNSRGVFDLICHRTISCFLQIIPNLQKKHLSLELGLVEPQLVQTWKKVQTMYTKIYNLNKLPVACLCLDIHAPGWFGGNEWEDRNFTCDPSYLKIKAKSYT